VNATAELDPQTLERLSRDTVIFLETGTPPEGLFASDVFCDCSMPQWRLQTQGIPALVDLRRAGHPGPSKITPWQSYPTQRGFVFEFAEEWDQDGEHWYAREALLAEVRDGCISDVSVYCTGDWDQAHQDQHRREVTLLRP
jgi:hypothetical protein